MFFKKSHKLPKFPDGAADLFRSLCKTLSEEEVGLLAEQLHDAYGKMVEQIDNSPHMNVRRLEEVYSVASYLMDHYSSFSKDQQALIVGGVRYFALDDDLVSDVAFYTGFDDDAKILNYVLAQIGVNDRFIRLEGSIWR
jgi:uncharacterized membrane protein YkvA (DUF1232 family)